MIRELVLIDDISYSYTMIHRNESELMGTRTYVLIHLAGFVYIILPPSGPLLFL